MIKMRLVVLKTAGPRSLSDHLGYLERDGVAPDGARGQAYGPVTEAADTQAFQERCQHDRHQFRFIVAPEDAVALGDLRPFTRTLMQRVESDLGTRLDWVAVDHWDTQHPHTHLVIRGRDEFDRDLIIARDYIQHGMRRRASALATEWLGPRTEREIRESLQREVGEERWTSGDVGTAAIALDRPPSAPGGDGVGETRGRAFLAPQPRSRVGAARPRGTRRYRTHPAAGGWFDAP
jgi:type IV secretory pathway VirD2 relaxase